MLYFRLICELVDTYVFNKYKMHVNRSCEFQFKSQFNSPHWPLPQYIFHHYNIKRITDRNVPLNNIKLNSLNALFKFKNLKKKC